MGKIVGPFKGVVEGNVTPWHAYAGTGKGRDKTPKHSQNWNLRRWIAAPISDRYTDWSAQTITVHFKLLNPTGHVIHLQFNIQQLYFLPTLYLCVLYLSENKQRLVPLTA